MACSVFGSPLNGENFLCIFDFDDSLINKDSDHLLIEALGQNELFDALYKSGVQWTNLMSQIFGAFSKEQLTKAIKDVIKTDPGRLELLRWLSALSLRGPAVSEIRRLDEIASSPPQVEIMIASDANTFTISEAFRTVFCVDQPSHIFSNPFQELSPEAGELLPDGRPRLSRINWYSHDHGCQRCSHFSLNMCKSCIVAEALRKTRLTDPTIIYVGDGNNDACPIQKVLRLRDHAFIRRGFALEKIITGGREPRGVCHHHFWTDGDDLLGLFRSVLTPPQGAPPRLPPLSLFGHENAEKTEFRVKSLYKQLPDILGRLILSLEGKLKTSNDGHFRSNLQKAIDYIRLLSASFVSDCENGDRKWPLQDAYDNKLITGQEGAELAALFTDPFVLPLPHQLAVYGSNWQALPWLHGEIYYNCLVWSIVHRSCDTQAARTASSARPFGPSITVHGFASWALPPLAPFGQNADKQGPVPLQTGASHVVDDESLPLPFQTPFFDIYQDEKDSLINSFFDMLILPMIRQVDRFISLLDEKGASLAPAAVKKEIGRLLRACLWGNAVDLSMFSNEELQSQHNNVGGDEDPHSKQDALIAANSLDAAIEYLYAHVIMGCKEEKVSDRSPAGFVDIIMDNCGVECAADMLFGLVLVKMGRALANRENTKQTPPLVVRYHAKPISYYVSDVMPKDFAQMVGVWRTRGGDAGARIATLFRQEMLDERIQVHTHNFWVAPAETMDMPPALTEQFFFLKVFESPVQSDEATVSPTSCRNRMHTTHCSGEVREVIVPLTDLVIHKGDLNYRRLCGDRHWTADMFFKQSSQNTDNAGQQRSLGDVLASYWPFRAVPVLALRTNKSEVCVGPSVATMDKLDKETNFAWRVSGSHAVALFAS